MHGTGGKELSILRWLAGASEILMHGTGGKELSMLRWLARPHGDSDAWDWRQVFT